MHLLIGKQLLDLLRPASLLSLPARLVGHTVTGVCSSCRANGMSAACWSIWPHSEAMPHPHPANIIQLATTSSRHQDEEAEVLLPACHVESSSPTRRQAAGQPSSTSHAAQHADHAAATGWQGGHRWDSNTRAKLCLCGAHALARWGWRTWEFAVVRQECEKVHAAGTAQRACAAQRAD